MSKQVDLNESFQAFFGGSEKIIELPKPPPAKFDEDEFKKEVNSHSLSDRLALLEALLTKAIQYDGDDHLCIAEEETYRVALSLLKRFIENDGKL